MGMGTLMLINHLKLSLLEGDISRASSRNFLTWVLVHTSNRG
jgi:hypothetical protein